MCFVGAKAAAKPARKRPTKKKKIMDSDDDIDSDYWVAGIWFYPRRIKFTSIVSGNLFVKLTFTFIIVLFYNIYFLLVKCWSKVLICTYLENVRKMRREDYDEHSGTRIFFLSNFFFVFIYI